MITSHAVLWTSLKSIINNLIGMPTYFQAFSMMRRKWESLIKLTMWWMSDETSFSIPPPASHPHMHSKISQYYMNNSPTSCFLLFYAFSNFSLSLCTLCITECWELHPGYISYFLKISPHLKITLPSKCWRMLLPIFPKKPASKSRHMVGWTT